MGRYDVIYTKDRATIEPHFCREWDETGGCYGTNPDHGYTLKEACEAVSAFYQRQAEQWREMTHPDAQFYEQEPRP